ncbi:MAG TPA: hemerythrin domain-containing protein [Acidimicrobiales bacterium]|nr:hemerythrin domain-containing protein [Acidimicrobiales bacterium]
MPEVVDLVDAIGREHLRILRLVDRLVEGCQNLALHEHAARKAAATLVALESRHEAAEVRYLWPVVRDALPEYADIRATAEAQEREARRLLHTLSKSLKPASAPAEVGAVSKSIRIHIGLEDSQLLPALKATLDPNDSVRLGRLFVEASANGPTRPHPRLPAVPGLVAAASPLAARVDRVRDLLRIR